MIDEPRDFGWRDRERSSLISRVKKWPGSTYQGQGRKFQTDWINDFGYHHAVDLKSNQPANDNRSFLMR